MSVEAPTAPSSRERHNAARDAMLKGIKSMEQARVVPASTFGTNLDKLKQSYQNSGAAWPEKPANDSDQGVYERISEHAKTSDGMLPGYENVVLSYMHQEEMVRATEAAVDPTVLGDNKEATIRELITDVEALPDDDESKNAKLLSLNNVLVRMQPGAYQPRGDELSTYVTNAEVHENTKDRDSRVLTERFLETSREDLMAVLENSEDDITVFQLMAAKHPAPARPDAPAQVASQDETAMQSPDQKDKVLTPTEKEHAEVTDRLAELMANRQKRMFGLDFKGSINKKDREYSRLEKRRMSLNQELIAEAIKNRTFASEDELNLFIATRTIDLCKEYDEAIRQKYMENDGPVGKAINFLTGRNPDGTPDKSKKKLAIRMLTQGLLGASLAAATIATGGAAAAVVASSAVTGARVYAQGQKIVRNKRVKRTGGLLTQEEVLARIKAVPKDVEKFNKEAGAFESGDAIYRNAVLEEATKLERQKINKDTTKWQLGNLATGLAGVVAGVGVGAAAHGILGGGEHHIAGATPGADAAAGSGDHTSWFGNIDPSNLQPNTYSGPGITVNPNEGYFSQFQKLNIPQDQWNTILQKVGPKLVQHGDAYWMPNGAPGIAQPGQMSKYALDTIWQAYKG